MTLTIISIGKRHEDWVKDGIKRYEERLRQPFDVKWGIMPHSSLEGQQAREEESERLLKRLQPDAHVILLDERGKNIDSPTLSGLLSQALTFGKKITIIIGGAYGVNEAVHARANFTWSLSKLVFPHQLVRLVLIEQIYRAQQIDKGSSYHH